MIGWTIRFRQEGSSGLALVNSLSLAVAKACELIAQGAEVSEIEGPGGLKIMGADEIKRVQAVRGAKSPISN
jgi:hypothetical protein